VCGITNQDDAQAAIEAGADLLGFIFYPESPRCVSPEEARSILAAIASEKESVIAVGVFVNAHPETINRTADFCGLDAAQLHGEEPANYLGGDNSPLHGPAYKALRPRSSQEARELAGRYALPTSGRYGGRLPAFLLDAYHPHLRGGTGTTADWNMAASLSQRHPLLLAGGLSPTNVSQVVQTVHPWGVDVASGVEARAGRKDHAALREFIAACKGL
jgi:phosphoribosylanthranilate isomerase